MNFRTVFNTLMLTALLMSTSCTGQGKEKNGRTQVADSMAMNKPDSFWKRVLSKEEYYILREKGTEKPYTGKWLLHKDTGYYSCNACGNKLFRSDSKFDSHCGWPSFDEELAGGKIIQRTDNSLGMERTEILCGRCGGHLGHLFDDGPTATGKRYCVNSVSLEFTKAPLGKTDTLVLGGGCFWCMEAVFEDLKGVRSVVSGYAGGNTAQTSYEDVCSGETGHAEVVMIIYDSDSCSLNSLLDVFFTVHDPCTQDQQGADIGSQYRSIIFYNSPQMQKAINNYINALKQSGKQNCEIVTQVKALKNYSEAEAYHQDYFAKNPDKAYCKAIIKPKLEKRDRYWGGMRR